MSSSPLPRELWSHPDPKSTQMYQFMQLVNKQHGLNLSTFQDLYQWSVDHRSKFYAQLFDFVDIIHTGSYSRVVDESAPINDLPRWFEGVQVNFAENVLWSRRGGKGDAQDHHGTEGKEDDKIALTAVREGCAELKEVSWGELRARSAHYAAALKAAGVGKGDRIVVVGSNSVETQLVLIATTWLGAIFSSSSSDMGAQGILQRTVQIDPKFIFMDDTAVYNGKTLDQRDKMGEILEGMNPCTNFQGLVSIPRFEHQPQDVGKIPRTQTLAKFLSSSAAAAAPPIERVAFHDPFLICYSSGTTGIPKAIVHSVGGVLISLFKEGRLHGDGNPSDVALQYTTVGWIMLLQIPAQLCIGARVVLYDGSPFVPDATAFVRLIGDQKVTKLGISPRWMGELAKAGLSPRELTDLSSLALVTSTGMVLSDELFEWFYDKGFPARVHLSNISGGTDIAGCFAAGNPLTSVRVGGCQGPSLGVPIAVFDSLVDPGGQGKPVPDGTPGELVATASFPNVPVFLWGDAAAPNDWDPMRRAESKYHGAYFARYSEPSVWAHGDHVVVDPVTGSVTFLGRADGVLNPSGVRFGSAEIYSVLEKSPLAEEIADSVVVGQRRPKVDNDESVMLFLMMRPGKSFSQDLVRRVREAIATERSKRHVPKYIFETPEIPTTINGKKIEIAIKKIVCGETVKPSGTVANPESLKYYYQFAKVEDLLKPKAKL